MNSRQSQTGWRSATGGQAVSFAHAPDRWPVRCELLADRGIRHWRDGNAGLRQRRLYLGLGRARRRAPGNDPGGNVAARFTQRVGDAAGALASADLVLRERFQIHRGAGMAQEGNGALDRELS